MDLKLPIDEQLEKEILGCCFTEDPSMLMAVRSVLAIEDFSSQLHQRIFRSLCRLVDAGSAANWSAVASDMQARSEAVTLAFLVDMEAPTYVLEKSLVRAKDLARRRALILRTYQLFHEAGDLTIRLDDLAARAHSAIRGIYGGAETDGAEDISAIIEAAGGIGRFLEPTLGVASQWPMLDNVTGGWQRNDLILIGARPSMGKTAFALDALRYAASKGVPSVFYSYEMSRESIVIRLVSRLTGIPFIDIRRGDLNASERRAVKESVGTLGTLPLKIIGASGKSALAIRVHAERLKHKGLCDIAVVDYIGLIPSIGDHRSNRNQELGETCRQLKQMASDLGIPLLVLSQLSRAPEGRPDKRPIMSDLRDSGELESHADLISFLHRPGYYNRTDPTLVRVAELIIAKQRNGATPIIPLEFHGHCGRFDSAEEERAA